MLPRLIAVVLHEAAGFATGSPPSAGDSTSSTRSAAKCHARQRTPTGH